MTHGPARLRRVEFSNFKAFKRYSITLEETNLLIGPNNAGKSTIIGALRTLDSALRHARARSPVDVHIDGTIINGYRIPEDSIPISLENIQTDYKGGSAHVKFSFNNNNSLELIFPEEGGCVLVPIVPKGIVGNPSAFRHSFPLSLIVVPVLGPVEHRERLLKPATVAAGLTTHRASRHFRNYWHYNKVKFDAFAALVEQTWPGMIIEAPELDDQTNELTMFCQERRITRELYWIGFGFQVWCQILTQISRADSESLIVVDEPEIYLHPDVQRQLLGLVRDRGTEAIFATHSTEIISEADPSEIVLIDKRRQSAERLQKVTEIQRALDAVGSAHNLTLAALARTRRLLFVEGLYDYGLLRRFARKLGLTQLGAGIGLTTQASEGLSSWNRVAILAAEMPRALGSTILVGAIYDRDYLCDEQVDEIKNALASNLKVACILDRKEIENYLLIPKAINRAILKVISEGKQKGTAPKDHDDWATEILEEITSNMKTDVQSQLLGRRMDYFKSSKKDKSELMKEFLPSFESKWSSLDQRLRLVPGKDVLGAVRSKVQEKFGVTLTDARICEALHPTEIPADMRNLLRALDDFRAPAGNISM